MRRDQNCFPMHFYPRSSRPAWHIHILQEGIHIHPSHLDTLLSTHHSWICCQVRTSQSH